MAKALGRLYNWFWYHTEIWIANKLHRRPYTYIMRDWIFTHPNAAAALILAWFTGLITLSVWHGTASTITAVLSGLLLGHLIWGSKWILGEQESPPYCPGDQELQDGPQGPAAAGTRTG